MRCGARWAPTARRGIGKTYLEKDDGSEGRVHVHELGKVRHEAARNKILDHELDEARRRLHTLESQNEERQLQLQTRPMRARPLQRP